MSFCLNWRSVWKCGSLLSVAKLRFRKLNRLQTMLPEGLLVDAAWMGKHGYSTSLRSQYVTGGWLEHPSRQGYGRTRGSLPWQQAGVSLQTLLCFNLVLGGRTAPELQRFF